MRSWNLTSLALMAVLAACDGGGASSGGASSGGGGGSPSAPAAPAEEVGETLATVNGVVIGSKEFEQNAARKSPASGDTLSLEEKQEVLDRLIEEKLLYEAALKKGLDRDPKVQKVMVNTLLREVVYANVRNSDFTDEELQKYYEEHKEEFVVPEKVQIKRILIKVSEERPEAEAKAQADRIRAELVKKPDSFKDQAAQYSEDPYRRRGGDVGFVARTGKPGLDQAIVDKAFELNVDQISDTFKTDEGFNIIQVANKRDRVERTFQQMKGSVLRKVKNDKLKELYDKYVAELKAAATVKTDAEKLGAIEIKSLRRPMGPGFVGAPGDEGGMDMDGDGLEMPSLPIPHPEGEGEDE